jgi:hypothetical protein
MIFPFAVKVKLDLGHFRIIRVIEVGVNLFCEVLWEANDKLVLGLKYSRHKYISQYDSFGI